MASEPQTISVTPVRSNSTEESAAGLVTRLLNDLTALVRNEIALAKSEFKDAANSTKKGLVGMATGGAVLYAGFLFLLVAATFGLAEIMEAWLAALIVGGIVTVIGLGLLRAAQRKLDSPSLRLDRTRESLRQDTNALRRAT